MRKLILLTVTSLLTLSLFAQPEQEVIPIHFSDTTWCDRGFDFYIGGGMFIGNKFNANYYNGSNLNENNLNYIFLNKYWRDELTLLIIEAYGDIGMDDEIGVGLDPNSETYNWDNHYKLSMMIALGMRYKIRKGWGLSLSYSFSRLTSSTQCVLSVPDQISGNQTRLPVMALVGKEDRSTIDFSASYLFSKVHKNVKPFLELGVQFNYAKAKSFQTVLLDREEKPKGREFTLLDPYNGENYYPGAQEYDITYGGPGFGFSGAAGLKIAFNKRVSIDPTFYCYMGRTGIYQMKNSPNPEFREGNKFTFNYGVLVRVVMSDFFFSRR